MKRYLSPQFNRCDSLPILIPDMHCSWLLPTLLPLFIANVVSAQDSTLQHLLDKYFSQVSHKFQHIEVQINRYADKTLEKIARLEKKMQARLWKVDSIAARNIFAHSIDSLGALKAGLKNKLPGIFVRLWGK